MAAVHTIMYDGIDHGKRRYVATLPPLLAAKTLKLATVLRMSDDEARAAFRAIRWASTGGDPVCPKCGCCEWSAPHGSRVLWESHRFSWFCLFPLASVGERSLKRRLTRILFSGHCRI
jgi:hypothetical protein